MKVNIRNYRDS